MPRSIIKRYLPDHDKIRNHKHLQCFGTMLHNPGLWHLNRHSVAGAFFVGLMTAFVPIPFQMVLAAGLAILLHVNLPISVILVWITNPVTMPPLFYFAYKVGNWVLVMPEEAFQFELSWSWLTDGLSAVWQPFLLGCVILGLGCGLIGYMSIQITWRAMVMMKWRHRRQPDDKDDIDHSG